MKELVNSSKIDRSTLDETNYFFSLVSDGQKLGLVSDKEVNKIRESLSCLFLKRLKAYSGLDSTSVRVECAESIATSALYTVGLYLKSFKSPDDALKAVRTGDAINLYRMGKDKAEAKLYTAKLLYNRVLGNVPVVTTQVYRDTVYRGIPAFFTKYDPEYCAQNQIIKGDYPVCDFPEKYVGIEFVLKYLERLNFENMICNCFEFSAVRNLFYGMSDEFDELIFNMAQEIILCAAGCAIAGKNVRELSLTAVDIENIFSKLSAEDDAGMEHMLSGLFEDLSGQLEIGVGILKKYYDGLSGNLTKQVIYAVRNDSLEKLFVKSKKKTEQRKIEFFWGKKMSNDKYSALVDELTQMTDGNERVKRVLSESGSLDDISDFLVDVPFTEKDVFRLLSLLSFPETVALLKRFGAIGNISDFPDNYKYDESLCKIMSSYYSALPEGGRSAAKHLAKNMVDKQ